MRRSLVLCLAVMFAGLAGCTGKDAVNQTNGGDAGVVISDGGVKTYTVSKRGTPLDFSGDTVDGKQVAVTALKGRVVVLNFWASWCAPCRKETTQLVQVANDVSKEPVTFLGVLVDDSQANARSFMQAHSVPYDSYLDPRGHIRASAASPAGVPTTVVLDKSGRVAVRFSRPVGYGELRRAVDNLVAETA